MFENGNRWNRLISAYSIVIIALLLLLHGNPAAGNGKIYWTNLDTIKRANLDGSDVEDVVTGLSNARGMDLDVGRGKIYWADESTSKIQRANLDGSNVEDVVVTGLSIPQGLAIDVYNGKVYWTDTFDNISRANLDGSDVEDLATFPQTWTDTSDIDLDLSISTDSVTLSAGQTGIFNLDTVGVTINITSNPGGAGALHAVLGRTPGSKPPLPDGIVNVSPDKFWTLTSSGLTGITYNLSLDLSGVSGISNFNTLKILKRPAPGSPWIDVSTLPGVIVTYAEPIITVNGLTELSDFGIGSDSDNPLPVELSSFTGVTTTDGVSLQWQTQTETNNLGFHIYRSETPDGKFERITQKLIPGAGTDATPHKYSFTDEEVVKDLTYYYYIEDVDFSGKTNKSHLLEVTVGKQKVTVSKQGIKTLLIPLQFALLQNYPNPFNPETWIPFELSQDAIVTIHIYDIAGRLVRRLELGNKPDGFYISKEQSAYWNGQDEAGEQASSGLYFYTIQADNFNATKRMILVK
ncbi:T9SS type A sorting domain-containing protein [bacterium]|nr:T9SS type A sorting domain-containing protein [bacterium]